MANDKASRSEWISAETLCLWRKQACFSYLAGLVQWEQLVSHMLWFLPPVKHSQKWGRLKLFFLTVQQSHDTRTCDHLTVEVQLKRYSTAGIWILIHKVKGPRQESDRIHLLYWTYIYTLCNFTIKYVGCLRWTAGCTCAIKSSRRNTYNTT